MSFFILFLLFVSLIASSILLHYGFEIFQLLPEGGGKSASDQEYFKIDYTFFLNIGALLLSGYFAYLAFFKKMSGHGHHHEMAGKGILDVVLKYLAYASYVVLAGGLIVKFFVL